jgi:hypothetical protein
MYLFIISFGNKIICKSNMATPLSIKTCAILGRIGWRRCTLCRMYLIVGFCLVFFCVFFFYKYPNNKRLLHDIFHIDPGISLRLPYQARQRSWRDDMGRGLIPGTIWKISCHDLFITYFRLTFSKHWLLYCKKDFWTDKLRK